jgi:molybdopterin synthase catalytic subunit
MTDCLTDAPIDLTKLIATVTRPDRGGVATFLGLVRDHQDGRGVLRLEYRAYNAMVEAESARISAEAEQRWPVGVALRHRLGALAIGDVAVAIAVASTHRGPAFEACRFVLEEVKRRLPIWKKEFYADGSFAWVDPSAAARNTGTTDSLASTTSGGLG